MEIGGASFGFFDQVGGEVEGGHLRAERGQAARSQPVATGNVQDVLTGLRVEKGSKGRPAQGVQDVYKKPYTFQLTFPDNIAFTT